MRRQEYLNMLWESKEWELNVQTAQVFKNLLTPHIAIPLLNSAEKILIAEEIRTTDDYEIEEEDVNCEIELDDDYISDSWGQKLEKANKIFQYDLNGKKTRAYYTAGKEGRKYDTTDNHLINTLFKQEVWNYKRQQRKDFCFRKVFADPCFQNTLCVVYNCADWLKTSL